MWLLSSRLVCLKNKKLDTHMQGEKIFCGHRQKTVTYMPSEDTWNASFPHRSLDEHILLKLWFWTEAKMVDVWLSHQVCEILFWKREQTNILEQKKYHRFSSENQHAFILHFLILQIWYASQQSKISVFLGLHCLLKVLGEAVPLLIAVLQEFGLFWWKDENLFLFSIS